ncbi:uncharacterized protein LOC135210250 [Macrobrachium nipponense]|uniref:uncharacterized protein LOC135210250 n=1 Tax=Macrobrachium nipponense TaxID=159736 RepID=UPI0030C8148A
MSISGSQRDSNRMSRTPLQDCESLGKHCGLVIYMPQKRVYISDEQNRIKIFHIGQKNNLPTKTVLLIGETGAGKTTLINSFCNHFFGVKFQDGYRMKLFAEEDNCEGKEPYESQTENITGYLFYAEAFMPYDHNIMIIDTPGLNDTRGCTKQQEIMHQMTVFLKEEKFGILDLTCLAFVVKANLNRGLGYFGKIIESCMKLFGEDTKNITQILKTFAVDKNSNIKNIFRDKWNIETESEFNFDNGILYEPNKVGETDLYGNIAEKSDIDMRALRWDSQKKEHANFFQTLSMMPSVSLTLTRDALKEKAYLEQSKRNLTKNIKSALTEIAIGRKNANMLRDYNMSVRENRAWIGRETTIKKTRVPLTTGSGAPLRWYHFLPHAHNCKKCNKTCVIICHVWIPCPQKASTCPVCNCHSWAHKKEKEIIKESVVMRNVTGRDMEAKIGKSGNLEENIQRVLAHMKAEEKVIREVIARMVKHICLHTERLSEISRAKTRQSSKEVIEEVISNSIHNTQGIVHLLNEDGHSFLQAVAEEAEKIEVNKEEWLRELQETMTESTTAWERASKIVRRVASNNLAFLMLSPDDTSLLTA